MPAPARLCLLLGLLGIYCAFLSVPATAQPTPGGPGVVEAALLLRQLDGVKRVLMIGAHPDDEDTALLAALARGMGARAAYLSLTRGEGGQNLIGAELGEGLGIVRSGELLAARSVDGAEQFFTRAYDFGYSKTAEETFRHWPRDSVLSDVVWAVRVFRPQVLVTVFSGTPSDGHGQHQVAGLLAREAFEASGDPTRFPEHARLGVAPWTPLKLYRRTWRDPEASTLALETGRLDPVLGRSYHQIAMRSRSQHRSQDFGTRELGGPHVTVMQLLESRVGGPDSSLFAGIDTTLVGLAGGLAQPARDRVERALAAYREGLAAARRDLGALEPAAAVPAMVSALEDLRAARAAIPDRPSEAGGLLEALDFRRTRLQEAILSAASVSVLAEAEDDIVVPGQSFWVRVKLWNGGTYAIEGSEPVIAAPSGWRVAEDTTAGQDPASRFYPRTLDEARRGGGASRDSSSAGEPEPGSSRPAMKESAIPPGQLHGWGFRLDVPEDFEPPAPYYLEEPRAGDLYRWPAERELRGRAFDPPPLSAALDLELSSDDLPPVGLMVSRPVRFRGVDKAVGQFWRPVLALPAVSVSLEPRAIVWPVGLGSGRPVRVTVRSDAPEGFAGTLRLLAPIGWAVEPAERSIELEGPGSVHTYPFEIRPVGPLVAGEAVSRGQLAAVARSADGKAFREEVLLIDYPHIEPVPYLLAAETSLEVVDVRVDSGRRVGYLAGSGDQVADAIPQLGLEVEFIAPEDLEASALERFDVIVLGVRAYEVRPDLAAANATLLDWVRCGGVLIVQYNKYELPDGDYAPYPLQMARPHDRVTDEASEVALLDPDSPALTHPNRISGPDFEGWVQERGLYLLSEWDERYTPLLAVADSGEEPLLGSLVVARVGEGLWVYTGLSFFRQLPAGVPGAYRLFANLLSLRPEDWSP